MMRNVIASMLVIVFVLGFVSLVGCTKIEKVYICANGKEAQNATSCGTNKLAGVKKVDAETYAKNYVNAYFTPYGGKSQLVSSYLDSEKGDYKATFIVAVKDGSPYETEVAVDGVTGKVACEKNCNYIGTSK